MGLRDSAQFQENQHSAGWLRNRGRHREHTRPAVEAMIRIAWGYVMPVSGSRPPEPAPHAVVLSSLPWRLMSLNLHARGDSSRVDSDGGLGLPSFDDHD